MCFEKKNPEKTSFLHIQNITDRHYHAHVIYIYSLPFPFAPRVYTKTKSLKMIWMSFITGIHKFHKKIALH